MSTKYCNYKMSNRTRIITIDDFNAIKGKCWFNDNHLCKLGGKNGTDKTEGKEGTYHDWSLLCNIKNLWQQPGLKICCEGIERALRNMVYEEDHILLLPIAKGNYWTLATVSNNLLPMGTAQYLTMMYRMLIKTKLGHTMKPLPLCYANCPQLPNQSNCGLHAKEIRKVRRNLLVKVMSKWESFVEKRWNKV